MRLSHPAPLLQVSRESVEQNIAGMLRKKNWNEFGLSVGLEYQPYYFFSHGEKQAAVHAGTNVYSVLVSRELAARMKNARFEIPHELETRAHTKTIPVADAEKTAHAALQLPEKEKLAYKTYYFPVWHAHITLNAQPFDGVYSALSGALLGQTVFPEKQKPMAQVARETVKELARPHTWIYYGRELAADLQKLLK